MNALSFYIKIAVLTAVYAFGSNVNHIAQPVLPNTSMDTVIAEGHDRPPTDTASILVSYRGLLDTLYGYKWGNDFLFEGDMLIKYPESGHRGVANTLSLWPKTGNAIVIVYAIDSTLAHPDRVKKAIDLWQTRVPNIRFEPRTSTGQRNYVVFVPCVSTQSYVGMTGLRQEIGVSRTAEYGQIAHEIGHCLGLMHEQSRSDRNRYVDVRCTEDINYNQHFKTDPFVQDYFQYDFYSIMHYPPSSCMSVKTDSLPPGGLPPGIPGQRKEISETDRKTVLSIYKFH